jgi:light-harvesting protein B-800-850 alpha chain
MIYGKIWLVVKPTVGIPIFLGAVAVGSFAVHLALVMNTTWIRAYHNGSAGKTASLQVEQTVAMAQAPTEAKR